MIRALFALLIGAALYAAPPVAGPVFKVRLTQGDGGSTITLPLEKYVAAVLAGESSVFRSEEGLKAMAVAARTYAVRLHGRHSAEGFDLCGTTHCQRVDLRSVTPRLESIAEETAGELLWFEGKPAFACYTRDCGGKTEDAGSVWPDLSAPYLKSQDDPYCRRPALPDWQWTASPPEVAAALRQSGLRAPPRVERIAISQRTDSGRARTLALYGSGESIAVSASSFRFALGRSLGWNTLRSDRYEVSSADRRFAFYGSGAGHGAGLCQRGADQLGSEGHSYREILAFYYRGTLVGLTGRGLNWVRLGGESIVLMTTQPDQDRTVLAQAERLGRSLARQASLPLPRNVEIRVYPDVETFRNATSEPGWVAAHTTGLRIHLQPVTVFASRGALEQTLRHELLHVMVESGATSGLPVWFREGLVGFLERPEQAARAPARNPDDTGLRQTADAGRARHAYRDATRQVAALVDRYGESAVLTWLRSGLPPELRNSSSSQAPTKSR